MDIKIDLQRRYPIKRDYPLLLLIIGLAAFLRFKGLNQSGLWLDEIIYSLAAQKPVIDQIFRSTETLTSNINADPTLAALPFSLSLKLGTSNFFARLPATLFSILTIPLLYRFGRTLLGNHVALLAAFLLSISSFHVLYAQEARTYAQLLFFGMASFLFLYQALNHQRRRYWLLYAVSVWGGASTHHLMIFIIASQGLFLILSCFLKIFLRHITLREALKTFSYFTGALVVVGLFRLPWLTDFTQRQCTGCKVGQPGYSLDLLTSIQRSLPSLLGDDPFVLIIFSLLGFLGLGLLLYRWPQQGLLLAWWSVSSLIITTIGIWFVSQGFRERYVIWGIPAFILLIASGWLGASQAAQQIVNNYFKKALPGTAIAVGLTTLLLGLLLKANLYQIQQDPLLKQGWPLGRIQEVATLLTAQVRPDEAIIPIKVSASNLQFFTQQSRPELVYFSSNIFGEGLSPDKLEEEIQGRWYIIHNTGYTTPNRPNEWLDSPDYKEFHDLIVVHLTTPCPFKQCIQETQTLLEQLAAANPKSRFATGMEEIVAKLKLLGF